MSLDLVQLRWQHIRTLEAYQLLQRENQSLREENEKLKARPPVIAEDPAINKVKDDLIKQQQEKITRISMQLTSYCSKLRKDYQSLKLAFQKDLSDCQMKMPLLYQVQNKYISLLAQKQMDINTVKLEKHECEKQIHDLQQQLFNLQENTQEEVTKWKTTAQQYKQDMKLLQSAKASLEQSNKALEMQLQGMQHDMKQFDNKEKVSPFPTIPYSTSLTTLSFIFLFICFGRNGIS